MITVPMSVDQGRGLPEHVGRRGGVVVPGEELPGTAGAMRGHGTRAQGEEGGEGSAVSTLAGQAERVNRLVGVRAVLGGRYKGEVGEVVVGRVVQLQGRRWRLDVGAAQDAVLALSAINLPGGVLRRRTDLDALQMRKYFVEGDLVVCEVQQIHGDGSLALHTRSLKYGKLEGGATGNFRAAMMGRAGTAFAEDDAGEGLLLVVGANGLLWAGPRRDEGEEEEEEEGNEKKRKGEEEEKRPRGESMPRPALARRAAAAVALGQLMASRGLPITAPRLVAGLRAALAAGLAPAAWLLDPAAADWLLAQAASV